MSYPTDTCTSTPRDRAIASTAALMSSRAALRCPSEGLRTSKNPERDEPVSAEPSGRPARQDPRHGTEISGMTRTAKASKLRENGPALWGRRRLRVSQRPTSKWPRVCAISLCGAICLRASRSQRRSGPTQSEYCERPCGRRSSSSPRDLVELRLNRSAIVVPMRCKALNELFEIVSSIERCSAETGRFVTRIVPGRDKCVEQEGRSREPALASA